MDILKLLTEAVLQILVGYLEFAVDLFSLQGLSPYILSDKVNPRLLSYFIVGSTIAYFLTKGKSLPGLSSYTTNSEERRARDLEKFGFTVFWIFLYAASSHGVLLLTSSLWPAAKIGTARDTLNAWLASAAIMLPLGVISLRLSSASSLFIAQGKKETYSASDWLNDRPWIPRHEQTAGNLVAGMALLALSLCIDIVIFVYYGLTLARMHRLEPVVGLLPGLLYFSVVAVVVVIFWLRAGFEKRRTAKIIRARRRRFQNPYMLTGSGQVNSAQEVGASEVDGKPISAWIEIANGGHCDPPVYRRRNWWHLRKVCIKEAAWEYDLAAQLNAIEALGKSESEEALDFLSTLLISESSESMDADTITEAVRFPSARGPLYEHLCYTHSENEMDYDPWTDEQHREQRSRIQGHQVIREAELKLYMHRKNRAKLARTRPTNASSGQSALPSAR